MRVWVVRSECQGSEQCVETAASVFATDDEYVSYVKLAGPDGVADSAARAVEVPESQQENVRRAARECPSGCIRIDG